MLGFPPSTEFNKRIPKQKFYENAAVPAAVKRLFADQLRCIYWRNKLAVSTLNLTAGERVTEIEIFELCLTGPKLDEAVLRQIDSEIPYHILFVRAIAGDALCPGAAPWSRPLHRRRKKKTPAADRAAEGKDEERKEFGKADGIKERNTKIGRGTINDKC